MPHLIVRYRHNLLIEPAIEPITLSEAKTHLRVDFTDDDTLITTLIIVARQAVEEFLGRALITQTWQVFYDRFPDFFYGQIDGCDITSVGSFELPVNFFQDRGRRRAREIELLKPPLQSVTHVKTFDNDDTETTFSTDSYQVSVYGGVAPTRGRITLRDGATFPFFTRNADGIEIQFIAGYGDAASDVPEQIKQAMLLIIAKLYEDRGDCDDCDSTMPKTAKLLLNPYRMIRL